MTTNEELITELAEACYMARQALFRVDHPQQEERRQEAYRACQAALEHVHEEEYMKEENIKKTIKLIK